MTNRIGSFRSRALIVSAAPVIAGGGLLLDHAFLDSHHRDVEGTAAQVVDQDGAVSAAAALVAEGGRRRFVDEPHDRQAGDLPGFARRLPLGVGEVGRDRDDGLAHVASERAIRPLLESALRMKAEIFCEV